MKKLDEIAFYAALHRHGSALGSGVVVQEADPATGCEFCGGTRILFVGEPCDACEPWDPKPEKNTATPKET